MPTLYATIPTMRIIDLTKPIQYNKSDPWCHEGSHQTQTAPPGQVVNPVAGFAFPVVSQRLCEVGR
jgi:hypothetical protein